jgi:hypothetical protein
VQALADSRSILATGSVVTHPQASYLLETSGLLAVPQSRVLRGIADEARGLRDSVITGADRGAAGEDDPEGR